MTDPPCLPSRTSPRAGRADMGWMPTGRRGAAFACASLWLLPLVGHAGDASSQASAILAAAEVDGGLVIHVGCGEGKLTAALAANERCVVHGLDTDPRKVLSARKHIQAAGLYGRAAVDRLHTRRLPYIDGVAKLIVWEDVRAASLGDVMRVLCPGGVALRPGTGGKAWLRMVKPWPKDIDEWSHFLHDAGGNAVANDARVGPPRHMQWLAAPLWCRYHHTLASISGVVSAGGRIFYIYDEGPAGAIRLPARWFLAARDAFSGVLLWRRPISSWARHQRGFRSGPVQLPRTLVTDAEHVYAPLGLDAPVTALHAATGETMRTYPGTERAEEIVLHEGVLLVVTGSPIAEQAALAARQRRGKAKQPKQPPFHNDKAIVALRGDTGEVLWRWAEGPDQRLMPLSLAAADGRVFWHDGQIVVSADLNNGRELWRWAQPQPRRRKPGWSVATMVAHAGVVLWADGRTLNALAADTGKPLWDCKTPAGFKSPVDVLVVEGLVWTGPGFSEGRDLRTGKVIKANNAIPLLQTAGHHHRCYREKATSRYIMTGKRGIEFLDLKSNSHSRNNWIRGACQYGVLPCNGLVYAPSHSCGCYMEAKLYGFWALSARPSAAGPDDVPQRLERGPAYSAIANRKSQIENPQDWPTYRRDPMRTGATAAEVPVKLGAAWDANVRGRLSAPVVAQDRVVLSSIDAHRVVALDARDGRALWTFVAGGRVDSPPTLHRELVLFGCADGYVYCLRGADGALVWRFLAAAFDRRTVALDQVESLWPVHGSVLVQEGVAYAAAGRSSYLDGGILLYGLDPATGRLVCQARVRSEHPGAGVPAGADKIQPAKIAQNTLDAKTALAADKSDSFSMAGGATTDVLVADGGSIYLRQIRFDRQLMRQATSGPHLLSTSRLLDGAENHRSHWVLGTGDFSRIPVAYSWIANSTRSRWGVRLAVPYGLLLAFDSKTVWGARRWRGYTLFAEPNMPTGPRPDFRPAPKGKDARSWTWSVGLRVRPRALLRAGRVLFVAGMPMVSGADAAVAFEGGKGGRLLAVSAEDGRTLAEYPLPSPPVWDGMAAAGGRLYLSMMNGRVACYGFDKNARLAPAPANPPSYGGPARPGAPVRPDRGGKLTLRPETARTTGRLRYQPDRNNLGAWVNPKDYCEWNLEGVPGGTYAVEFTYGTTKAGWGYTIVAGNQRLAGKTENTRGLKTYKAFAIGAIVLPEGHTTLTIKPDHFTGAIMNFRLLTLTPSRANPQH